MIVYVEKLRETSTGVENTHLIVLVDVIEGVQLGAQSLLEKGVFPTDLVVGDFLRVEQRGRRACRCCRGSEGIDPSRFVARRDERIEQRVIAQVEIDPELACQT